MIHELIGLESKIPNKNCFKLNLVTISKLRVTDKNLVKTAENTNYCITIELTIL